MRRPPDRQRRRYEHHPQSPSSCIVRHFHQLLWAYQFSGSYSPGVVWPTFVESIKFTFCNRCWWILAIDLARYRINIRYATATDRSKSTGLHSIVVKTFQYYSFYLLQINKTIMFVFPDVFYVKCIMYLKNELIRK